MGKDIHGSVIGNRFLGKATALLCRYTKASGVYSPEEPKTTIAILITGNVSCQIGKIVQNINNTDTGKSFKFEKAKQNLACNKAIISNIVLRILYGLRNSNNWSGPSRLYSCNLCS